MSRQIRPHPSSAGFSLLRPSNTDADQSGHTPKPRDRSSRMATVVRSASPSRRKPVASRAFCSGLASWQGGGENKRRTGVVWQPPQCPAAH